jgi:hypothetical protein
MHVNMSNSDNLEVPSHSCIFGDDSMKKQKKKKKCRSSSVKSINRTSSTIFVVPSRTQGRQYSCYEAAVVPDLGHGCVWAKACSTSSNIKSYPRNRPWRPIGL